MSYESSVRLTLSHKGYEKLASYTVDYLMPFNRDEYNLIDECNVMKTSADHKQVYLGWNQIKWYKQYEEVAAIMKGLEYIKKAGYAYEFCRVGEDVGDYERISNAGTRNEQLDSPHIVQTFDDDIFYYIKPKQQMTEDEWKECIQYADKLTEGLSAIGISNTLGSDNAISYKNEATGVINTIRLADNQQEALETPKDVMLDYIRDTVYSCVLNQTALMPEKVTKINSHKCIVNNIWIEGDVTYLIAANIDRLAEKNQNDPAWIVEIIKHGGDELKEKCFTFDEKPTMQDAREAYSKYMNQQKEEGQSIELEQEEEEEMER